MAFLDNLVKASRKNTYKERVNKLARSFKDKEHGRTPDKIRIHQQTYDIFMELAGAHASKIAKHKFGYKRYPELMQRGAQLLLYKHIWTASTEAAHLHHQSNNGQQH
jgi:hypothetical protein